jgi:sialic acid synthase SpsE
VKRPGYGIPPKFYESLVGRKVKHDLAAEAVLNWADIE